MFASLCGLPYAMQRTPVARLCDTCDLPFVNCFDQELQIVEWRRRQHSVTEIENVTCPPGRTSKYVAGAFADQLRRAQQHGGIQVSLNAAIVTDPLPAGVKGYAPVERDDVRASRCDRLQQSRRVRSEMNSRDVQRPEPIEDRARMGEHAELVVLDRQHANP